MRPDRSAPRTRTARALPAAVLLALGLLTAGCGGSADAGEVASLDVDGAGDSDGSEGSDASGDDAENDPQAFAACMRENGVNMEDPGEDGKIMLNRETVDADEATLRQAMENCRDHMPQMGRGGEMSEEQLEGMQKFAECMRENGIDFPDPEPGGGIRMGGDIDPDDPAFQEAMDACRDQLAGGGIRMEGNA